MNNVWLTSDQHFGHANIIKYSDRPFYNVHEMNRTMTERWNEKIAPNDTVIHVGDLIFGKPRDLQKYNSRLNGKKILIRGNHDRGPATFMNAGFLAVHDKLTIDIGGRPVMICHYPFFNDKEPKLKFAERRPEYNGNWLIHGHVHTAWKIMRERKMINVSVEAWDYYPVSLETIINIIHGTYEDI